MRRRPSRIAQRQGARPGAVLAEDERVRPPEAIPGLGDRPRERRPEDRVRLGRGQEVAVAPGPGLAAR